MRRLAELLRSKRGEIIATWKDNVLADPLVPRANSLRHPALENNVPQILDEIIGALERGLVQPREGRLLASSVMPREHAQIRFAQNYTLGSTLRELSHLRDAMVDAYWNEGSFDPRGVRLLHAALDECMSVAGANMEELAALALEADRTRLEREVEVRERFVAILGHDLRSPLNTTKMAARLIEREAASAEQAEMASRIVHAVDRMNALIDDLLDFARLREGHIALERRACDIGTVCREVAAELRLAQPRRTIDIDAPEHLDGQWDRARLAQVLTNLVGNALSYSPAESVVQVKAYSLDGAVQIEVHNEGDPIPVATQTKIFEPFERGQHRGVGVGLGLFIAREMVHAHGGTISVVSDVTTGTTFTVCLPREEPDPRH